MKTIAVLGTFDTKGHEHAYLAERIRERGHRALLIDVGTGAPPTIAPDISRDEILLATEETAGLVRQNLDRGAAGAAMSRAAPVHLARLYESHRIEGVISLGGGCGTSIATAAMRALPLGFPKVMVSTLASGNTAHSLAEKDLVMVPSIVDVSGLNRISRPVFCRAAGIVTGMIDATPVPDPSDKPLVVASMVGNTTECVETARAILGEAGFEVVVFHATGTGGRTMESIIASGIVSGVLDITTTELADELAGGVLSAGMHRLDAAASLGIPAVVAPGCLDMINFHGPETVPSRFADRLIYEHNAQVTLVRTSPDECAALGEVIAQKLNAYRGPVTVLLPLKGVSALGAPGHPFHDAEADEALFAAFRDHLDEGIEIREIDTNINDHHFAEACADALLENMAAAVSI